MTRVGVAIYQPIWTGEPCHWVLWLQNEIESVIWKITDSEYGTNYRFDDPLFTEFWNGDKRLELIHCGTFPSKHLNLAWDLIETHRLRSDILSDWHSQDWVFKCLGDLVTQSSVKILQQE